MKYPAQTDIAVLMLFFNRPDSLRVVFEQVRKARPTRLFLFQDGPRNKKDLPAIMACREVVAEIDWDCHVHRNYQEQNLGCMTAGFTSHRWAFSLADKCIVLEDDVVPTVSFFRFCKEMLDRYEHDERITMVAGYNMDEVTPNVPNDYFFTSAFSIWGWASWSRVVNQWDEHYTFMDDKYDMQLLRNLIKRRKIKKDFIRTCQLHRSSGVPQFETIFWASMLFNSGLSVMPVKNMISNVGATDESAHYSAFKTLPRGVRRQFTMKSHEIEFPLRHPHYVIEDVTYKERMYRYNAWGHPWIKIGRSIEELLLNLRYGNFKQISKAVTRRFHILTGTDKEI